MLFHAYKFWSNLQNLKNFIPAKFNTFKEYDCFFFNFIDLQKL